MSPVRFSSVTVWGWNGSSGSGFRFRFGSSKERVFANFVCVSVQYSLTERTVPVSVPGKMVPAVPVSGSGSVPGPHC